MSVNLYESVRVGKIVDPETHKKIIKLALEGRVSPHTVLQIAHKETEGYLHMQKQETWQKIGEKYPGIFPKTVRNRDNTVTDIYAQAESLAQEGDIQGFTRIRYSLPPHTRVNLEAIVRQKSQR